MRPFLAMLGGTAAPAAVAAVIHLIARMTIDLSQEGLCVLFILHLLFPLLPMAGLFGAGFGVIGSAFAESGFTAWKGAAFGIIPPVALFLGLYALGGFQPWAWMGLAVLFSLVIQGALAGAVAARIMAKGTHGTA